MTQRFVKLGGIRVRVTLITMAVCLVAMACVVGLTALASRAAMEEIISRSLTDRLDTAEADVALGDFQEAIDDSGIELLQVIDEDGNVIASTRNARGLSAILADDDRYEVDDLELDRKEASSSSSAGRARGEVSESAELAAGYSDGAAVGGHDDDDDLDDDADDAHDDADDADDGPDADDAHDDADDADDDDFDDDGAAVAQAQQESDDDDLDDDDGYDYDDFDDDDGGYEDDDDGDDDDDGAEHGSSWARFDLNWLVGTPLAFAEEADELTRVEASSILGSSGPFLVMRRTVDSPEGEVTLVAMTSLAPALETAERTAGLISGVLLILLVLAGIFTWSMTGRTLAPVDHMRREVESISAHDLASRITPPENDRDLSALAETFNGLIGRIEASVEEQKRFVSDASHELKSPIASTQLMLETLRDHPDAVEQVDVLADLLAENTRLQQIVDDLLTLTRQDEGRLSADLVPVDFYDLLYEEVSSLRQRFPVTVDASDVQPVIGKTDAGLFSHAVRNLLDNAARYAHSTVAVSCWEDEGIVRILVSDDGPGIPEADRERVFGRFVRLEEGRSRRKGSTGLGLSVARGNIERLGGTLRFIDPEIGGATACVELPAGM